MKINKRYNITLGRFNFMCDQAVMRFGKDSVQISCPKCESHKWNNVEKLVEEWNGELYKKCVDCKWGK